MKGNFHVRFGERGEETRRPQGRKVRLAPTLRTGTFLQTVIERIYEELSSGGQLGAWSGYVSEHLLPRLYGFELLMGSYAVAHLKLGLRLAELGYDFRSDERLRVYLTNTLEEPHEWAGLPLFTQELAREVQAANLVKSDFPIMIILGNPPYSGHSANKSWEIREGKRVRNFIGQLLNGYYYVDGQPLGERNPKWLQDDYVKFIRFAQWRIERTGYGILAFISNHGYLDNPTFRGMRQSLLGTFDEIYLLNLHGNSKKRERCPDGFADENVFDIQQGVAIGFFVKRGQNKKRGCSVRYADLWGLREVHREGGGEERELVGGKYHWLWAHDLATTEWETVLPEKPFYLFVPQDTGLWAEYERGWKVTEAMPVNVLGFQTHRDHFAIDLERSILRRRIAEMRDYAISDSEYASKYRLANNRDWHLDKAREHLRKDSSWENHLIECLYRPFDQRPCYFSEIAMDYPRRELLNHVAGRENLCLLSSRQQATLGYRHCWVAKEPANDCVISTTSREANQVFPLYLYSSAGESADQGRMLDASPWPTDDLGRVPNLNPRFAAEMEKRLELKFAPHGQGDLSATFGPEDIFHYIYALLHSPTYRARYVEFLKIDFPRVPLTGKLPLFAALAAKGAELAGLHLMESPVLGQLITRFPEHGDNCVEQVRYVEPAAQQPGRVYINQGQYFEGVPPEVWAFHVGGYQVLEKWLKDRKGRHLSFDDLLHYQKIVVALRETLRLMKEIDQSIEGHGGWPIE